MQLAIILILLLLYIIATYNLIGYMLKRKVKKQRSKQQEAYMKELLGPTDNEELGIEKIIEQKTQQLKDIFRDEIIMSVLRNIQVEPEMNKPTLITESSEDHIINLDNKSEQVESPKSGVKEVVSAPPVLPNTTSVPLIQESDKEIDEDIKEINESEEQTSNDTINDKKEETEELINVVEFLIDKTDTYKQPRESDNSAPTVEFDNIIKEIQRKKEAQEQARFINEETREIRKQNMEVIEKKIQQEITTETETTQTDHEEDPVAKMLAKRKKEALRIAQREQKKKEKKRKKDK